MAPAVSRSNPAPLYRQVETVLRHRIQDGEWNGERRLPSEDELAEQFRVSKITVRQALARLAAQRLLVRRPGLGTFVNDDSAVEAPLLLGALDDLSTLSKGTTMTVLQSGIETADDAIAEAMGVEPGERLRVSRRVRRDAKGPVSYVETYFPAALVKGVNDAHFAESLVIPLLERKLGLVVDEARQTTAAAAADARTAKHLRVPLGSPMLLVRRLYLGPKKRVLCYMVLRFRGDRYRYAVSYRRR